MANIITPDTLRQDTETPHPTAMWDAIWNLYSTYQAVHGQPPKYLYLNTRVWEDVVAPHMFVDICNLGLKVIDDHELLPNRVDMWHQERPVKEMAKWQRSFTDDEGEEKGLLSIE